MTLRTTALIAGALGLLLLIAGLIADGMRPQEVGTPRAAIDAEVLVVGPDQIAIAPGGALAVEGSGAMVAYVGRTADVEAWTASRDVTVLTGVPSWEELSTEFVPAPPAPSPTASPSAEPSAAPAAPLADIWRESWAASGTLELDTTELLADHAGLTLVVVADGDASLTAVELTIPRAVDDAWVSPLKWWGAVLAAFGLLALIWLIVDLRAARGRVESSVAGRRSFGPARPGGRRDRREAAAESGAVPLVETGASPGDDAAAPADDGVEAAAGEPVVGEPDVGEPDQPPGEDVAENRDDDRPAEGEERA